MGSEPLRSIAIVLNGMLVVVGLFLLATEGDPGWTGHVLFAMMLLVAPASALAQMLRKPKRAR
jgi:hypothetical protein